MKNKITLDEEKRYSKCPICGGYKKEVVVDYNPSEKHAYRYVMCVTCGFKWKELYYFGENVFYNSINKEKKGKDNRTGSYHHLTEKDMERLEGASSEEIKEEMKKLLIKINKQKGK